MSNPFMSAFKHFKKPQNFTAENLIDIDRKDCETMYGLRRITLALPDDVQARIDLIRDEVSTWRCYEIDDKPGLKVIRNPFSGDQQRLWIRRCLTTYARDPNKSNLDATRGRSLGTGCILNDQVTTYIALQKLRWITLGYHYDWTAKVYDPSLRSEFPTELADMCTYVARCNGYGSYTAEAAIVNYYPLGSTLSGHTDISEVDHKAPLFSFSLGNSAVFLVGGLTKDTEPRALLLRSGDVVIMEQQSRLAYHAVPCIIPNTLPGYLNADADSDDWRQFADYIKDTRINMNVRHVGPLL